MSEETMKASTTIDEIYRLAARKAILFYVAGDTESEINLAAEIERVRENPELHFGPILAVINDLFPDGKLPSNLRV